MEIKPFIPNTMRAMSWKEPYGSLMLHGKIETRPNPTKVRGLVLICTSKLPYSWHRVWKISRTEQYNRIGKILGAYDNWQPVNAQAIAVGNIIDCRPMTAADEDACFVKYDPDVQRYCWIFDKAVRAIQPFPWKGSQGWSFVPAEIQDKIIYL